MVVEALPEEQYEVYMTFNDTIKNKFIRKTTVSFYGDIPAVSCYANRIS